MILQKFWSDHNQDLDKIIKRSSQDLSKILKISFQDHWKILSRSWQDPAASCRILSKILHDLTKGLAKILSNILPWFHQDLVQILPRFSTWDITGVYFYHFFYPLPKNYDVAFPKVSSTVVDGSLHSLFSHQVVLATNEVKLGRASVKLLSRIFKLLWSNYYLSNSMCSISKFF